MIIIVKYGHNQMTRFRERHSQSLVKIGQIWSNLVDGSETTILLEIHI